MAHALTPYLADLEERLDEEVELDLQQQWIDFLEGRFSGDIFIAARKRAAKPKVEWPTVLINETLDSYDAMALQQFGAVSEGLGRASGQAFCVRSNYGVGILPSVFGVRIFMMDDEQNTLPNVWPLDGGLDAIRKRLDEGIPDPDSGFGRQVFEMGEYYRELMAPYPKISRFVSIYHPDLQGAMDVCELLWGSGLFMDLIDRQELVHDFLTLITETYIAFMQRWNKIVQPEGPYSTHWSLLHKGRLVIRDDSAMNLSPDMFDTFIRPYDQRLLATLGGGLVHFCGRGDHYIESLTQMDGLTGVNMSQPELNDMEKILSCTVDRGIPLLGFDRQAAEELLASRGSLNSRVHCW